MDRLFALSGARFGFNSLTDQAIIACMKKAIAHKAKIGPGYISDLESGRRKGTTAALKKIAAVLKVPLDLIA